MFFKCRLEVIFICLRCSKKIKPSGENDTFWSLDGIMKNNIKIKQTLHIFYSKYIIIIAVVSRRRAIANSRRQSKLIGISDDNSVNVLFLLHFDTFIIWNPIRVLNI